LPVSTSTGFPERANRTLPTLHDLSTDRGNGSGHHGGSQRNQQIHRPAGHRKLNGDLSGLNSASVKSNFVDPSRLMISNRLGTRQLPRRLTSDSVLRNTSTSSASVRNG